MNQIHKLERKRVIINTCLVNIGVTFLLATVKIALGLYSHSTALVLDAVNYYTDVLATGIIIVGAYYYAKEPDLKHPFGYGRIEYVATLIMGLFFLSIGIESMAGAVAALFVKSTPTFSWNTIIILSITIVLKALVGKYTKKRGLSVGADAVAATGNIAIRKAKTSVATIISALLAMYAHISLDKILSVFFAFLVLRASGKLLGKTIDNILGKRVTAELVKKIKKCVASFPEVRGAYDLVLHNYGPDEMQGSVHIEVDDTLPMDHLDTLIRDIRDKVIDECDVDLTGISIYSVDSDEKEYAHYREEVRKIALAHDAINMHGFYMNAATKQVSFDTLYSLENPRRQEQFETVRRMAQALLPDYKIKMTMDLNIT